MNERKLDSNIHKAGTVFLVVGSRFPHQCEVVRYSPSKEHVEVKIKKTDGAFSIQWLSVSRIQFLEVITKGKP